jgi:ELWxxDGT repeat protein
VLVKDIAAGIYSSYPGYLVYEHGILMFSAFNLKTGRELWRSDGTPEGTMLVKKYQLQINWFILPQPANPCRQEKLVFAAYDEKNGNGYGLLVAHVAGSNC